MCARLERVGASSRSVVVTELLEPVMELLTRELQEARSLRSIGHAASNHDARSSERPPAAAVNPHAEDGTSRRDRTQRANPERNNSR